MTTENPLHDKPDETLNAPAPEEPKKPDVGIKSGKGQLAVLVVGVAALVGLVVVARMYT